MSLEAGGGLDDGTKLLGFTLEAGGALCFTLEDGTTLLGFTLEEGGSFGRVEDEGGILFEAEGLGTGFESEDTGTGVSVPLGLAAELGTLESAVRSLGSQWSSDIDDMHKPGELEGTSEFP